MPDYYYPEFYVTTVLNPNKLYITNKYFIHRYEIDIDIGYDHPSSFFLDLGFNVM